MEEDEWSLVGADGCARVCVGAVAACSDGCGVAVAVVAQERSKRDHGPPMADSMPMPSSGFTPRRRLPLKPRACPPR